MRILSYPLTFFLLFSICLTDAAAQTQVLKVSALHLPQKVLIDNVPWVYYELLIRNLSADSVNLKSIAINDLGSGESIFSLKNANDLKKLSNRKTSMVPPKSSATLYFEFPLRGGDRMLHHIKYAKSSDKALSALEIAIPLIQLKPIVLAAPLQAGPWVAVYDPNWESGHRRVIFSVGGAPKIPGRFAIDFVKVDLQGRYARGDSDSIKNWFGYKANVLAVNDGVVVSVKTAFKESLTLSKHPDYDADQASGNYIAIKLADSIYAFYEHLQPGSIKVMPGDQVKKGQVIASLGFTGQSTGPHLHFHLADRDSPLDAEGIPFVFESFATLGAYPNFDHFGTRPWVKRPNGHKRLTKERPGPNSVLNF